MKTITILALLLGLYGVGPRSAQAQGVVKLSLASCEGYYIGESAFDGGNVAKEPDRFLKDKVRAPVDLLVLLENKSSSQIGIYRQWNSWGYYSIHFVVEGPDGKQTVIEKESRAWTKNYPDCFRLPSGMTHGFPVCFTSKEWKSVDALSAKGARIKAVFQQKRIEEDLKLGTRWSDVQIFTNKIESAFVLWEGLNRRKAN